MNRSGSSPFSVSKILDVGLCSALYSKLDLLLPVGYGKVGHKRGLKSACVFLLLASCPSAFTMSRACLDGL